MMPLPGLRIYLQPHVILTFDLLHLSCVTVTSYRNMCLCLVKICPTGLEISCRKGFMWLVKLPCDFVLSPPDPQSWLFHILDPRTTCAIWHQNPFICFQNTAFTSLVTDEWTDEQTDCEHSASVCQSGLTDRNIKHRIRANYSLHHRVMPSTAREPVKHQETTAHTTRYAVEMSWKSKDTSKCLDEPDELPYKSPKWQSKQLCQTCKKITVCFAKKCVDWFLRKYNK